MEIMSDDKYEFLDDASLEQVEDPAFDRWIARAAATVNEPGLTPHDEMWAAIAAAGPATSAAGTPARVLPFRSQRWAGTALLAAALLIGIGIDRLLVQGGTETTSTPVASSTETQTDTPSDAVPPSSADLRTSVPRIAVSTSTSTSTSQPGRSVATPVIPRQGSSPVPGDAPAAGNLYRLAAVQTLSQAEALLTAYRASGVAERDPAGARQLGRWGRDVLSSTRLLLDSPAGDDPAMRPLLNDLELVLVQIIRLSGTPLDASERALIDRSLRERDLLPRIHTAVPAGTIGTASDD
jgi:hypothetical protein